MADPQYAPVSTQTIETLWPEPETRPREAWQHVRCGLIVTSRAAHEPGGLYPCPSLRPNSMERFFE